MQTEELFRRKKKIVATVNYFEICKNLSIDESRVPELNSLVLKFKENFEQYKAVSVALNNFPIDLIFALHYRESSLSFAGVLHNGERILGKGLKTKLVPKGRGPFNTWVEAAIDALLLKKNIFPEAWAFEARLEFAEKFNGLGYRSKVGDSGKVELSPYVFAGTNVHDETGKYVADGKYSSTAKEKQLGVAAILLMINKQG